MKRKRNRRQSHHISIRASTYDALKQRIGKQRGERGRIAGTVDRIVNDYIDQQGAKQ